MYALSPYAAPVVIISDDFSSGSGVLGTINGWEETGPETKNYNVGSSGVLEWNHTGDSNFDSVALAFSSQSLIDSNDSLSVSFDYQTLGTVDNGTGFRIRLYERGSTLFETGANGYALNAPSGNNTGNISYRDIVNEKPFATGIDGVNAISGSALGNGGSFVFTVTKTGVSEITLSGSNSVRGAFSPDVRSATVTNFDSFGVSVGSIEHGLQIDSVQVTFSPAVPNDPPSFSTDPISSSDATEYIPYSGTIAGTASDPEGDPLTYSKTGGPAWLNVAADGVLSGAPGGAGSGLNSFTVQVADDHGGMDTATLEITVVDGSGRIAFSDDFSSGSGTLGSINGWTEQGPEDKDYNVGASGILVMQDDNGDEKGTGAHSGFFDTLYADLGGSISLPNVGDWIQLSLDFDIFTGSYGGATNANDNAGLRISLTESGTSTNAGYGLYIATGNNTTHSYQEMKSTAAAQSSIANALTGVDISEDSSLKNLTLVLSRIDSGVQLSGLLDGNTLATITNSNSAIIDNLFDTLSLSVASRDHGLKLDNVEITVPATSTLWNQYVVAKGNGTEPILPDFSYAGYHFGEAPIPTVDWTVFNVTNYGAVADDSISDKAAIESAIAAAESNGSGIVFFPPGRFLINEQTDPINQQILIEGSRIVLRGSGSGTGGTELFMDRHMDPADPAKIWSSPYMFRFKGYGDRPGTASDVVADSRRETHSVTVANASIFSEGDWVQLHRVDNSAQAVAEAVAPYAVDTNWVNLINTGVLVDEINRIESIVGNVITFKAPIHSDVTSTGNWSVVLYDALEEVGVENIAFTGNWTSNFVHHRSFYDDGGWSILEMNTAVNSWIRNCRFTDCNRAGNVKQSAAVTVSDVILDGNKGHSAISLNLATHCLVAMVDDSAGHYHACGVVGRCSGNVFWKSEHRNDTSYESHASQPRCTLFDNTTGGFEYSHMGGAVGSLPNHLNHLILWNYESTGVAEPVYDFFRDNSETLYQKVIMPYVIGFHGTPQVFDESKIGVLESNGTPVEPASLYEAQYKLRMGKPLTQLFYDEWTAGHGLSGSDDDYTGDPDNDFRANLAEYAVGGIPTPGSNSPQELPRSEMIEDGGFTGLEYIYARRRNAAKLGLTYDVEFTDNLMTNKWSATGVSVAGVAVIDDDFESVTNRVSTAGTTNGFVRLKVEMTD
jgi:hypothetical protein